MKKHIEGLTVMGDKTNTAVILPCRVKVKLPPRLAPDASIEEWRAWNEAKDTAFEDRRDATVKVQVEVDLFSWGILNEAAVIHGCTPQEALQKFLDGSDAVNEWANAGCPLLSETGVD